MDATRTPGKRLTTARFALVCGVAAFAASAWLSASADTEVYKWVDPQGRIHYSDRPPPSEGKLLSMESSPSSHARTGSTPPPATVSNNARPPAQSQAAQNPQLRTAVADDVANAHATQCKTAQDRYQTYVNSRHLYREGQNGERIYLSDAELETERVNAKREADEACATP